ALLNGMAGTSPAMTAGPLRDLHVFEVARLVVDTDLGRRDPAREPADLHLRLHQALDEILVAVRRQEFAAALAPLLVAHHVAGNIRLDAGEFADVPVKRHMRQPDLERNAETLDH